VVRQQGLVMKLFPALLLFLMLAPGAWGQNNPFSNPGSKLPVMGSSVLPVDEAFSLQTFIETPDQVVLVWDIQKGYYLYRESITAVTTDNTSLDIGELPFGKTHSDEFFGEVDVYYDRLIHRIPMNALPAQDDMIKFTLMYQGCAEDKYCYPIQEKSVVLELP